MVESVSHIFERDVLVKEQVTAGQFDLFTEERNIILPRFWDAIVEPDMKILMEVRPVGYARATSAFPPPPPIRPYHGDNTTFSTSRWRSRESSSDYSRLPRIRIASSSPRSPRQETVTHAGMSSSDDSDDGLFEIPISSKARNTVKPTLQTETSWSRTRVAQYLAMNWFSQEWVTAFRILGLEGEKFLALGSPSSFGTLHRIVYPELERLFLRGGKSWNQAFVREEGMRLRKLIRSLTRAPSRPSIDLPQEVDATPEFQVSDESLDQLDDASNRFKPQANNGFDQGQIDLLRDQIFAFKELSKYGFLTPKLQEHLKLSTTRDFSPDYRLSVNPQLVTGDEGLSASNPYMSWGSVSLIKAQHPGHRAYIQSYGHGSGSVEVEDESREKGRCPHPDCGKVFRDLKAHMLTHQAERSEKCPIASCEYHQKGFARKYDKNRHLLTHFKGRIICPFCPGFGTSSENVLSRLHIFSRHLITMHRVKRVSGERRPTQQADKSEMKDVTCPSSTCDKKFHSAQEVFEHLDECICTSLLGQKDRPPPVLIMDRMRKPPVSFGQPPPSMNSEKPLESGHLKDLAKVIGAEVEQQNSDIQEIGQKVGLTSVWPGIEKLTIVAEHGRGRPRRY